ncbi:MAG: Crp/Fnr family transcriptional regulator [Bacteroidetes bacterium]|nr:MAG: Crp/Fnr family transcriptional regulator [Bacteroidota bacterium]
MAEKTKLWYLENFNLFKGLCNDEMEKLMKSTVMKEAKKGQYIYFPEEPSSSVFLLKEGKIKIGSFSEEGKETIKAILNPGEIFGELSLAGEEKRSDFAQALTDNVVICAMSKDDMEMLMEKNAKIGIRVTKIMGLRLKRTERKINDLIFKDVRTRIIDFLKDWAKEEGVPVGDEIMIKHNLTHQDIANLTATTRQSVTTILNELKDKNLIYTERKKILIRDIQRLR